MVFIFIGKKDKIKNGIIIISIYKEISHTYRDVTGKYFSINFGRYFSIIRGI